MIPSAWRESLNEWDHETRFYFNPRGIEYPAITDTLTYSQDEEDGISWCASGGTASYLFPCTAPIVVSFFIKAQLADTWAIRWVGDTTTLQLSTNGTLNYNNGTDYNVTSYNLNTWLKVDIVLLSDSMSLYVNNIKYGPETITAIAGTMPILEINGAAAKIRKLRMARITPTEVNITSMFKGIKDAEYFCDYAKRSLIHERCNITRFVSDFSIDSSQGYRAKSADVTLNNHTAAFTDDLYAAFDPTNDKYNGLATQEYLQRRMPLWIEEYYIDASCALYPSTSLYPSTTLYPCKAYNTFFASFYGHIAQGSFTRATSSGSTVSISADDYFADLSRRSIRVNRYWEDLYIADSTNDANSLFHQIAYLGTKKDVYNYLCNSSFENATIANSWGVSGGTLTRTSGGLLGSHYGALSTNGASASQTTTFGLSSGERFTFQVLISGDATVTIKIAELDGAVPIGYTDEVIAVTAAEGWKLATVTHDIIDSDSDRLTCSITLTTGTYVGLDAAMLSYGDAKYCYINNTNDGTAGVCDYTDADYTSYAIIGVHSDTVPFIHPWGLANAGETVLELLTQIADASIAQYMRINNDGVLVLRSNMTGIAETNQGTISGIQALISGVQDKTANKLKVQGAYINKKPNIECVWELRASNLAKDSTASGSPFSRAVADDDYFPLLTESPNGYEALYGDVYEGTT